MNGTLISLFLALMMVFGSGEALPDSARTLTVSDLEMMVDGEQVSLTEPEWSLTFGQSEGGTVFHSEIGLNGETYLPITLAAAQNSLRAVLSDSGIGYEMTPEDFSSAFVFGEEENVVEEQNAIVTLLSSAKNMYGDICSVDSENYQENMLNQMNEMLRLMKAGKGTETTLEMDGTSYPAMTYTVEWVPEDVFDFLDALAKSNLENHREFLKSILEVFNMMTGLEYDSFAELYSINGDDEDMTVPIAITVANAEDRLYITQEIQLIDEYWGWSEVYNICFAYEDGAAKISMQAEESEEGDEDLFAMTLDGNITEHGVDAIVSVRDYTVTQYSDEEDDGTVVEYLNKYDNTNVFSLLYVTSENSSYFDVKAGAQSAVEMSENGEITESSAEPMMTIMDFSVDTVINEDQSKQHAVSIEWNEEGSDPFRISFDLNDSQGAAPNYFDGLTLQTVDAESAEADPTSRMADIIAVQADLMALHEDADLSEILDEIGLDAETILAMSDSETDDPEVTVDDPEVPEDDTGYPGGYDPVSDEEVTVYDWDDAAVIFDGSIPDFTEPDGYECNYIEVNSYNLQAYYTDGTDEFALFANLLADGSSTYYSYNGDELAPANCMVDVNAYDDGTIYSVTATSSTEEVTLYFITEFTEEEALEILTYLSMD